MSFLFAPASQAVSASSISSPPLSATAALLSAATHVAPGTRGKAGGRRSRVKGTIKTYNVMAARPSAPAPSVEQSIQVCMTTEGTLFTTSSSVPTTYGLYTTIAGFAQSSEYLSLFDQYRIDLLEVWVRPTLSQGNSMFSDMASCIDLDDANTPISFAEVEAHQRSMVASGGAGRYHVWQPHVATAVYSGAFTSFSNEPAGWIDSASPNVQHYGVKFAIGTETVPQSYLYTVRGTVTFRAPGI